MKKTERLTEEQRIFAEQNHVLVEEFIAKKRLKRSDFYDVVIFGYLDAVKDYLEKPELSRYCFRAIAWVKMKEYLMKEYNYLNLPKRKAPMGAYHEEIVPADQAGQVVNRTEHTMGKWDDRLQVQQLLSVMTPKEKEVVYMRAAGYTYREIADCCSITVRGVSARLEKMRRRLRAQALI